MIIRAVMIALVWFATLAATRAETGLATVTIESHELPLEYRLDGVVEAVNRSTVSAQTGGQIEEILFDVDDFVEKGALIVKLKDTEQRAALSRAQADLKAARARLQEAEDEHQRIEGIFAKKLVSQSAMDKSAAALKAARAARDSAVAGESQAREQLDYTRIRAPYSGILTERHLQVGEYAAPGARLISGISLDKLRVIVDVPQSLIPGVRARGQASVQQPGNGYIPVERMVIFPYADNSSNTFKVRLELPSGVKNLFPGMFVKTAFAVGTRRQLLIPDQSVVYRSEVTGCYLVAPDGTISLRHIRTGHTAPGGMIRVLSGLETGEQVALDPIAAGAMLKRQQSEPVHD